MMSPNYPEEKAELKKLHLITKIGLANEIITLIGVIIRVQTFARITTAQTGWMYAKKNLVKYQLCIRFLINFDPFCTTFYDPYIINASYKNPGVI